MTTSISIHSERTFDIEEFLRELDLEGATFLCTTEDVGMVSYYFYFKDSSTTLFALDVEEGSVSLCIDGLAAWDDYKRFPYILDILCLYLTDAHYVSDGKTAYQLFDEDWIADTMGEAVAYIKATLGLVQRYYVKLPIQEGTYITEELLNEHGVSLRSSTPRIYGYIHYLMRYHTLPSDFTLWNSKIDEGVNEVYVPQHESIGKVKSWMLDGSETWESYSQEDVDLLLLIAASYSDGNRTTKGVVLNDIGTIYQMGIGVTKSGQKAAYWFNEGYRQGDHWFSPTNLGDLYRKGCAELPPDLQKAYNAYLLSDDPYAWYRIGQAWEEGWIEAKHDLDIAISWYRKSAKEKHHLAIKALQRLGVE